jgi:hypothetical protein
MHRRYAGAWYSTLALTQRNTLYSSGGRERKSEWLQHVAAPGRMRIDYLPLDTRSGVLYEGDRVHVFVDGRRQSSQPGWNVQLVLTADVYTRPPDSTMRVLDSLRFDPARIRRDTWEGRAVWVVGAAAGDSTSNQFWVDAERLLLARVIQTERQGARSVTTDTRFDRYLDVDGFPIAHEVVRIRDGRPYFREQYTDVRVNVALPEAMFDPARWAEGQPVR